MQIELAIIGGTGLYNFPGLEKVEKRAVETPYGAASDAITLGEIGGWSKLTDEERARIMAELPARKERLDPALRF